MSGWEVGDIAVCLRGHGDGIWRDKDSGEVRRKGPRRGQLLTVTGVAITPLVALSFKEFGSEDHWAAHNFLKVTPPPEMIKAERKVEVPA